MVAHVLPSCLESKALASSSLFPKTLSPHPPPASPRDALPPASPHTLSRGTSGREACKCSHRKVSQGFREFPFGSYGQGPRRRSQVRVRPGGPTADPLRAPEIDLIWPALAQGSSTELHSVAISHPSSFELHREQLFRAHREHVRRQRRQAGQEREQGRDMPPASQANTTASQATWKPSLPRSRPTEPY